MNNYISTIIPTIYSINNFLLQFLEFDALVRPKEQKNYEEQKPEA